MQLQPLEPLQFLVHGVIVSPQDDPLYRTARLGALGLFFLARLFEFGFGAGGPLHPRSQQFLDLERTVPRLLRLTLGLRLAPLATALHLNYYAAVKKHFEGKTDSPDGGQHERLLSAYRCGLKLNDGQVRDHPKVAEIPGTDSIAEVQGGRTDQQVLEWNHQPDPFRLRVDLCRNLAHLFCERLHWNRREDGVQVCTAFPGQFGSIGAMQTVLQLDHGNRRDYNLGFSALLFESQKQTADWSGVTLGGDQHTRVED
jgi:hypothetical protein